VNYRCAVTVREWMPHDDDKCATCVLHMKISRGGRPKKATKNRGRPPERKLIQKKLNTLNTPRHKASVPLAASRFVSAVGLRRLLCIFCHHVVDGGVEIASCQHLACKTCLHTHLEQSEGKPSCPECSATISDVGPMPPVVQGILQDLQLQCDHAPQGCPCILPLGKLAAHVKTCSPPNATPVPPLTAVQQPFTPPRQIATPTRTLTPFQQSWIGQWIHPSLWRRKGR
jgi:hypothetical protein